MKDDEGWMPPQRKPVIKEALNRATGAEEEAAPQEHQVREAWFDGQHGTVMLELTDGRVFGVEPSFIPSLQSAAPAQLAGLRASNDGAYLVIKPLDLHVSVNGLVTRIIEESPMAIKCSEVRPGGRPKSKPKTVQNG